MQAIEDEDGEYVPMTLERMAHLQVERLPLAKSCETVQALAKLLRVPNERIEERVSAIQNDVARLKKEIDDVRESTEGKDPGTP